MRRSLFLSLCFLAVAPLHAFSPSGVPSRTHSRPVRTVRLQVQAPDRSSSLSDMSDQMLRMRKEMEQDEKTQLFMQALRGQNINDDDAAAVGTTMQVVRMTRGSGDDALPTVYEPRALSAYFAKRPAAVLTRVAQIVAATFGWACGVAFAALTGDLSAGSDAEVEQVRKLRGVVVSLGPFYIKLGQALSIRPDILSPRAMVELQQLCDKVPPFDSKLAMLTIEEDLGKRVDEVFSQISPEPVAAASLGQVYRATLRDSGDVVAVKVQRPFVLETVSLDLYLARQLGFALRGTPLTSRLDLVELIDEFAGNFYQELDYQLECANGLRVAKEMARLPRVVIPRNYPSFTSRRVHVAEWVDGEKLSQSTASDVNELVNLGVITYLTQLLETGFFHADPHPGNMLRTPDGKLVILDFGLMTTITDDQRYGMIEAIAHLIHRDYERIGDDFVALDFIPKGVDTTPIVPALARVFDAALTGGGAKSLNFQELAADLAEITFKFPFRIPPYFALIIRAISVLEGIALVGNPQFAIVDEAYPYISKRLLTDESPRLKAALRYMVYGKSEQFDVDRMIDLLQALEKFVAIKDTGDGTAFKVDGVRGGTDLGSAGTLAGTRALVAQPSASVALPPAARLADAGDVTRLSPQREAERQASNAREALRFFFAPEGDAFRGFLLDEVVAAADALSREAVNELLFTIGARGAQLPPAVRALAPPLTAQDEKVVTSIRKLVLFFLGGTAADDAAQPFDPRRLLQSASSAEARRQAQALLPVLRDNQAELRGFGLQLIGRLSELQTSRALGWVRSRVASI